MNWNGWSDFFHMGGYGLYVWGSFGVTAVLIAGEILTLRRHRRKALKQALRTVQFDKTRNDNEDAA